MVQMAGGIGDIRPRVRWRALSFSRTIDAGVAADFPVELAVAHVDGVHLRRAVLEQAIGEAPGGCADVEAERARGIDAERRERRLELETARG